MSELPSVAQAVADLQSLKLFARRAVEGTLSGQHFSQLFGSSIEFSEHKIYTPGDDLRHADWKVFGRADKLYVKKYENETNTRVYLVLDASGSMSFESIGYSKLQYAQVLSATLAYLFLEQSDLVGLVKFGSRSLEYIPPRGRLGHFDTLALQIQADSEKGPKKLFEAVRFLREKAYRKALVFVVSDFLGVAAEIDTCARMFPSKDYDVYWMQVLDPAEISFPYEDFCRFAGLEGEGELDAHGRESRRSYLEALSNWLHRIRSTAMAHEIHYNLIPTDTSLTRALGTLKS